MSQRSDIGCTYTRHGCLEPSPSVIVPLSPSPTGLRTLHFLCSGPEHTYVILNEWMNEWGIKYSALLCIAVHPKHFTIIWGGLSSTATNVQHSSVNLTLWFIILSCLGRGDTWPSYNILLNRSISFATKKFSSFTLHAYWAQAQLNHALAHLFQLSLGWLDEWRDQTNWALEVKHLWHWSDHQMWV